MGAATFFTRSYGKDAKQAFASAREQALYEHGHSGYSGSVAEKSNFRTIVIPNISGLPEPEDAVRYGDELIERRDQRIDDKWGPAGCIEIRSSKADERLFLFFGWAPE